MATATSSTSRATHACYVNAWHAAFLGYWVADDAAFFIAPAAERLP
jgi:hypothetical protein